MGRTFKNQIKSCGFLSLFCLMALGCGKLESVAGLQSKAPSQIINEADQNYFNLLSAQNKDSVSDMNKFNLPAQNAETCFRDRFVVSVLKNSEQIFGGNVDGIQQPIAGFNFGSFEMADHAQTADLKNAQNQVGWAFSGYKIANANGETTAVLHIDRPSQADQSVLNCRFYQSQQNVQRLNFSAAGESVDLAGLLKSSDFSLACKIESGFSEITFHSFQKADMSIPTSTAFLIRRGCLDLTQVKDSSASVSKPSQTVAMGLTVKKPPVPSVVSAKPYANGGTNNDITLIEVEFKAGAFTAENSVATLYRIVNLDEKDPLKQVLGSSVRSPFNFSLPEPSKKYRVALQAVDSAGNSSQDTEFISKSAPFRPVNVDIASVIEDEIRYVPGQPPPPATFSTTLKATIKEDTLRLLPNGDPDPEWQVKRWFISVANPDGAMFNYPNIYYEGARPWGYSGIRLGDARQFYLQAQRRDYYNENSPNVYYYANNSTSSERSTNFALVPSVPRVGLNISVVDGDAQSTISFDAVCDACDKTGGIKVINFEVVDVNDSNRVIATFPASEVKPSQTNIKLIKPLVNGKIYTLGVRMTNAKGVGYLDPDKLKTAMPSGAPLAPTDIVATVGDRKVSIAFKPAEMGSRADTFEAVEMSGDQTVRVATSGTTSPLVIADLVNDRSYTYKIRGKNKKGPGDFSATVTFVPKLYAPKLVAESSYTIGAGNSGRLKIANSGGDIESCSATGLKDNLIIDSKTCEISGFLNAGPQFTVQVTARNRTGINSVSFVINVESCKATPVKYEVPMRKFFQVTLASTAGLKNISANCTSSTYTSVILVDANGQPVTNSTTPIDIQIGTNNLGEYTCQTTGLLNAVDAFGKQSLSCGNLNFKVVDGVVCNEGSAVFQSEPNANGDRNTCAVTWKKSYPGDRVWANVTGGTVANALCNSDGSFSDIQASCPVLPLNSCPGGLLEITNKDTGYYCRGIYPAISKNSQIGVGFSSGEIIMDVSYSSSIQLKCNASLNIERLFENCRPPLNQVSSQSVPASYPFGGTPPAQVQCPAGSKDIISAPNNIGQTQTCKASWLAATNDNRNYISSVSLGGSMSQTCNTSGAWVNVQTFCPAPANVTQVQCAAGTQDIVSAPNNIGQTQTCKASWSAAPNDNRTYTATVTLGGSMSGTCNTSGAWVNVQTFCPAPANVTQVQCAGGTQDIVSAPNNIGQTQTCKASWSAAPNDNRTYTATVTLGGSMSGTCNTSGAWVNVQTYCPAPVNVTQVQCAGGTQDIVSAPNNIGQTQTCKASWSAAPNDNRTYTATVTLGGSMSGTCNTSGAWVNVQMYCPAPANVTQVQCAGGTQDIVSAPNNIGQTQTCKASWSAAPNDNRTYTATVTLGGSMSGTCNTSGAWVNVQMYCPAPQSPNF